MQAQTDLALRVQVLEQMLEVTLTAVLSMSTAEQRQVIQRMLAETGRIDTSEPSVAHECRKFIGEVAVRFGKLAA